MAEDKRYDVFLSYSADDHAWVSEFVSALRAAGVKAWSADDIRPGEDWQENLQYALRQSNTLLIVLGPDSASSSWLYFELGAAIADGKRIIPLLRQDLDLARIPPPLRRFQWLRESSPEIAARRIAEVIEQEKTAQA